MDCTLRYIKENLKKFLLLENKIKKVIFKNLDRNFFLLGVRNCAAGIPLYRLISSNGEYVYNSYGLITHIETTFGKKQKYLIYLNDWLLNKYNTSIDKSDKKLYQQYKIDLTKHLTKSNFF